MFAMEQPGCEAAAVCADAGIAETKAIAAVAKHNRVAPASHFACDT
jgi:hypothetical protein